MHEVFGFDFEAVGTDSDHVKRSSAGMMARLIYLSVLSVFAFAVWTALQSSAVAPFLAKRKAFLSSTNDLIADSLAYADIGVSRLRRTDKLW